MKAKDLVKKPFSIEKIYEQIKTDNEHGHFKSSFPLSMYITNETKLKLISNGFKVYEGIRFNEESLIIEW